MIQINTTKAKAVTQEKIRVWREAEFKKNDVDLQNALVDGADTTVFVERRNYLRDLPTQTEGKTIEELKNILAEIGA